MTKMIIRQGFWDSGFLFIDLPATSGTAFVSSTHFDCHETVDGKF